MGLYMDVRGIMILVSCKRGLVENCERMRIYFMCMRIKIETMMTLADECHYQPLQ